ncbi:class I SAM-dependent methyltransferase [Kineococcus rhizosphaerae]|uniref:Methyltransferase family protein n=1 Tax=Kineococcus rhizosphaerae TaxID=559628 RepID=A0A2T0QZP2_9ACTN|nr:class I SAM-dependent methyltransferase [Kineococcus rhizosphaerae]PRY12153.1 methyltransferase family protein [Kineococcus rhizosphaerae]
MDDPAHLQRTRHAYDVVARSFADLLPGLDAETALDVAVLDDFAHRCRTAGLGPVADVGCGAGRVSAHLAAAGLDVVGYDLSPGMVDTARRDHPGLRFEVAALHDLPVADGALGGLLAWYSLIHTPPAELRAAAAEFARVTAAGAPLLTAFQAGTGERVERAHGYGHAVTFTNHRHDPQVVADVLTGAGFDVVVRLHRAAEGRERTPQHLITAQRRS